MGAVAPLSPAQRRALARLSGSGILDQLYLAGGVAVAFHLGHRRSNDLDFFSSTPELDLDVLRRRAIADLGATVVAQSDATLKVRVSGAVLDFVMYPYRPLARPAAGPDGVRIASLRDLAVMKLAAIARRGLRRDFWDLHEILTRTRSPLRNALRDYQKKFGTAEADLYHVVRALTWFEDADGDTAFPRGLTRAHWTEVKRWFEAEAAKTLRAL